jgi:hypothetical protein
MSMRMNTILAAIYGFVVGIIYFTVIHPLLTGMKVSLLFLTREPLIAFYSGGILIIFSAVLIGTSILSPASTKETIRLAFVGTIACLFPFPFVQFFIKAPKLYGESLISLHILKSAFGSALIFLLSTIAIVVVVCAIVRIIVIPICNRFHAHRA